MTDDFAEDATLVGETAQHDSGRTAAVSAVSSTDDAALAWSAVDDGAEDIEDAEGRSGWRHRLRWAAVVTLLSATTAAAVWLATAFYQEEWASATQPEAAPAVTPVAPPPKPAAPQHIAPAPAPKQPPPAPSAPPKPSVPPPAAPPKPAPPEPVPQSTPAPQPRHGGHGGFTTAEDQRFLQSLEPPGYVFTDPGQVIELGHQYCRLLQQGESVDQADGEIAALMGEYPGELFADPDQLQYDQLGASAMLAYPNCY